ncbi:MAG: hypothetical protein ABI378_12050 [Chitinophagaceae bacterium]
MRKLFFTLLTTFFLSGAFAQIPTAYLPDYYKNLEKYWFYRYRLINDFLKIGGSCGESIPASKRFRHYDRGAPVDNLGHLEWGDATEALGHYIGTLATEYKLLQLYGWDTKENKNELYYALNAFDRLDWNSEEYMRDLLGTYPCKSAKRQSGDLNGFFVRDDVTQDLVNNNFNHFNRPEKTRKL